MKSTKIADLFSWLAMFCLPYVVLSVFFFIATMTLPLGFYSFLRVLVFFVLFCFGTLPSLLIGQFNLPLIIVNVIITIIFNPIVPFYFGKSVWIVIDVICAITMIINAIYNCVLYFIID